MISKQVHCIVHAVTFPDTLMNRFRHETDHDELCEYVRFAFTRDQLLARATRTGWTLHTFPLHISHAVEARRGSRRVRMWFTVDNALEALNIDGRSVHGQARPHAAVLAQFH